MTCASDSCRRYGCMTLRTCAALAALCLLAAGCGGSDANPSREDRTQVRQWLPKADEIRCSSPREHTRSCEVTVRKVPVGVEHWHCSFADYSEDTLVAQSNACWTEDGSQDSLAERLPGG